MNNEKFSIRINYIVLTTDIAKGKQYILSIDSNEVKLPSFILDSKSKENLEQCIIQFIKKYTSASDIELIPQLIRLDTNLGEDSNNIINTVYGFIIDNNQLNNAYWKEFDYEKDNKFLHVILETVQKLR